VQLWPSAYVCTTNHIHVSPATHIHVSPATRIGRGDTDDLVRYSTIWTGRPGDVVRGHG